MGAIVSVYIATGIDGRIAGPDDDLSWLRAYEGSGTDYGYTEYMSSVGAVVMGAKTYEFVLGLGSWPYGDVPGYVVSHRALEAISPLVHVTDEDPCELVRRLASETEGRLWVVGGASIVAPLADADLIDEWVITLVPVIVGAGVGLWDEVLARRRLLRTDVRTWDDGLVQLTYTRA